MNSTWKRSFAMLLSLVMVFGMLPVNAFATGEGGECSHVYSETVTTAATCTTEGVKTFTCGNCGHSYTEGIAVDSAAHSYSSAVTAPTCEAAGYTTYTCACGDNYTADEVAATGHSYGEDGKCAACGAEKPAEVHTHSFDELVSDTATCTEAGVKTTKCSCGETTEAESAAKGHSFSDGVADPVATCAVSGVLTKTCNVCSTTETEVLPATGEHSYENGACTVCTAEEPVVCDGTENCAAETHETTCEAYDWCAALACGETHHADCPWGPCTLTEGCELVKNHPGECTGMSVFTVDGSAATYEDLVQELENGNYTEITLTASIDKLPTINRPVTIIGAEGVTVAGTAGENQFGTINGTVTLKNIVFTNGDWAIRTDYTSANYENLKLVLDNCTFNNLTKYAIMGGSTAGNGHKLGELVVTGCTFNASKTATSDNYMLYAQCVGKLTVTNCTFNGEGHTKGAIHTGDSTTVATEATITNSEIKGVARGVQIGNRVAGSSVSVSSITFTDVTTAADSKSGAIYVHENADDNAEVSVSNNTMNSCTNALYNDNNTDITSIVTTFDSNIVDSQSATMGEDGTITLTPIVGGTVAGCFIMNPDGDSYITTAINNVYATESIVLKLTDAEGNLLATSTLVDSDRVLLGKLNREISGTILISKTDAWWNTVWEKNMLRADHVPATITLYVDGVEQSSTPALIRNNVEQSLVWGNVNGVLPVPVATITRNGEEIGYGTLADALTDAKNGDTIELLWTEGDAPIDMQGAVYGKSVTITGTATVDWSKGNLYVGRGGEGDGTLIFDGANITSSEKKNPASTGLHVSGSKGSDNNTNNGKLIIRNSNIETDYLINRNEVVVESGSLTVYGGCYTHGRDASESSDGTVKTATFTINSGASVNVINENGMGVGGEGSGVMNVAGTYTANVLHVSPEEGATGTVNINGGTVNITGDVTNNDTINVNGGTLIVGGTLTNNDTVNVYGESTLNIATLSGNTVDFQNGAIIKDSTVGGDGYIVGNVIFRGENTFNNLYDFGTFYTPETPAVWTVEAGASVTLTHDVGNAYGLGYGDNVTVNGSLQNALAARETLDEGSYSFYAEKGIRLSTSSGNDAANGSSFTVNNAYAVIGKSGSFSNSKTAGKFKIALNNSVIDAAQIYFSDSGDVIDLSITGSDVRTGIFMTEDADSVYKVSNSKLVVTATGNDRYNGNKGSLTITNSTIEIQTGAFTNTGTLTVDMNSTFSAPEIVGNGTIIIDVTGFTGDEAESPITGNVIGFTGEIRTNNGAVKATKVSDGEGKEKIVLTTAVAEVGEFYYYDLAEAIEDADGQTVKLLKDVTVSEPVVVEGTVTLDMNGKTISNTTDIWNEGTKAWSLISVKGGNLTITGNGTLDAFENDCFAVDVRNNGVLTIENGTFNGNVSAVYVHTGSAIIEGGTYSIQQVNEYGYAQVLNCYNPSGDDASIVVKGGTFVKHDPSNADDGNLVVPGYCAVADVNGNYTIKPAGASVTTSEGTTYYETLTEAVAKAGEHATVTLLADGRLTDLQDTKIGEINANGYKLTGSALVIPAEGYTIAITHIGQEGKTGVVLQNVSGIDGTDQAHIDKNGVIKAHTTEADTESGIYGTIKTYTFDKNGQVTDEIVMLETTGEGVMSETTGIVTLTPNSARPAYSGQYMTDLDSNQKLSARDFKVSFPTHDNRFTKGTSETLYVQSTGFFQTCTRIYVDSEKLKEPIDLYIASENFVKKGVSVGIGSTNLDMTSKFLNQLDSGTYTIVFVHEVDGKTYTPDNEFVVGPSPSIADETNPKTGDSIMMAVSVMAVSAAALATLLILNKKKHTMI